MLFKEDFTSLQLLADNIKIYSELNDKTIVLECINEMREKLTEIEKEFK